MINRFGILRILAALALSGAAFCTSAAPATPYWSVDLGRYDSRERALAELKKVASADQARVEQRAHGWYVRAGAYAQKTQAQAEQKKLGRGHVIQVEHAAAWLTASTPPVAAAPAPAPVVAPVAPPAKTPVATKTVPPAAAPKPAAPAAAAETPASSDLTGLELEQLLAMQVTGVTGRSATYLQSPAAIFVLTGDDIHRAGVRTIADALRMVPGLQVYRTSAQDYTVTSRGFGADKLQVLVDGRSVYSPLTSTVFWDVLDTYLEDIARIEVIRGPGATVWGANAVNGVINIVTKSSADTTGTHVFGGGGNEERGFGGFRSGGRIGDFGTGRAYVQAGERDATIHANGTESFDGISKIQAGGRVDGSMGSAGTLMVSGDVYKANEYTSPFPPTGSAAEGSAAGRNVAARWSHPWSEGSETVTSLWYDGYDRLSPTIYSESRDTYDLNVQHNMAATKSQRLTFGVEGRVSHDETGGPPLLIVWQPPSRTVQDYSAFVQDEFALSDAWSLLVGSKFENNTFTNFEFEPSARLGWSITQDLFTWISASRATRTPNRLDHDLGILCTGAGTPVPECTTGGTVISIGSPIDSEKVLAYEWGLRAQVTPDLITDLSLFANDYTDLRTTETGLVFANNEKAEGYGGEATGSWRATDWATLSAFYSYVLIDARTTNGSTDTTTVAALEGGTPQQTAGLRAGVQPLMGLSVDSFLRYVDNVPAQHVPNYTELNLRVGYQLTPQLELSLVGENLLDASHPETGASTATRAEIQRSVFGQLSWRLW